MPKNQKMLLRFFSETGAVLARTKINSTLYSEAASAFNPSGEPVKCLRLWQGDDCVIAPVEMVVSGQSYKLIFADPSNSLHKVATGRRKRSFTATLFSPRREEIHGRLKITVRSLKF